MYFSSACQPGVYQSLNMSSDSVLTSCGLLPVESDACAVGEAAEDAGAVEFAGDAPSFFSFAPHAASENAIVAESADRNSAFFVQPPLLHFCFAPCRLFVLAL
ncbi:hypothetical protein OMP38_28175 [Cohnella ginsengisoli]|uniref:Uncharacterized protein n=1 Tax=Cohnella ginsengisoli TaxID=425004 RepID=A0A9X4KQD8_9BACL|nr:hypothetical protein [Cohnella ginsengisoli]MDG0794282.1 hypothetical protein [Cohnella ginsengisoli]